MSITRTETVTVVEVQVDNAYMVALTTLRRDTTLDPDDAITLADELFEAATEAKNKRLADERQARAVDHGFDGDPCCRDCKEGKHGACNGTALVEVDDDVELRTCPCGDISHYTKASV